jgi:hypothetical protein
VKFENVAIFYTSQQKKAQKNEAVWTPKYCLDGNIKKIVASSNQQILNVKNQVNPLEIFKEVGSLLFIETEIVASITKIFTRAIFDLVQVGKDVELDLSFCKMTLSKANVGCAFRTAFMKELCGQGPKDKIQELHKRLYGWKSR